jgi:hypothetical protein
MAILRTERHLQRSRRANVTLDTPLHVSATSTHVHVTTGPAIADQARRYVIAIPHAEIPKLVEALTVLSSFATRKP